MTPDAENLHEQPDLLEERLSAYLDGMLDADERAQLEAHLADCDTCQQQLAELRRVRALLRALPQPALPRSFLLPVEAPAPATTSTSPATPIPFQPGLQRQRVARMARAAQWLGTIAAVLGLAILVSTAVLGARGGTEASSDTTALGGAATAASPAYNSQTSTATTAPSASTVTATGAPGVASGQKNNPKAAEGAQNQPETAQPQPSLLDLELGGGVLLIAGIVLVIVSSLARRRNSLNQLAPPATGN